MIHSNTPNSVNGLTSNEALNLAPLGKQSAYINTYTPSLLFPIPRKPKRDEIHLSESLPFIGYDIWTGFELSWLNSKGKPVVAIAEFIIPCESKNIVESKSFKLYLNSFNNTHFESFEHVHTVLQKDLSQCTQTPIEVKLFKLDEASDKITYLSGKCIDDLDVECNKYQPETSYLTTSQDPVDRVEESFYTNLLKSNCLVTGQPDWGSIQIQYKGPRICQKGLLKYIVSLRDHNEFHEQCVERIFTDIQRLCQPEWLTVYARYTRRGGLDINPFRTNQKDKACPQNVRLIRQ